jgi:TPP-dependent pyruvate/acetoin dehydrogenase alpha subunit
VENDLLNLCLDYYYQMVKIRRFEEALNNLYAQGHINGTLHLCVGQEAVAVGACGALNTDDYITSTHRGHGHFIAKGGDITRMMAELFGLPEGYCGGAGGTQHMADFSIGHLGSNGITAGQIPVATGAALALKMSGKKQVAVCFFGDGAANEGVFHESLNMAAIWNLPIIYICENNLYAMSTPFQKAFSIHDIAIRSVAYGMRGRTVDGMDVLGVKNEVSEAVEAARSGKGPTLIECKTYRFSGHSKSDPRNYRTREEEALWQEKDPINLLKNKLYGNGALEVELENIENRVKSEIENAIVHCQDTARAITAGR